MPDEPQETDNSVRDDDGPQDVTQDPLDIYEMEEASEDE